MKGTSACEARAYCAETAHRTAPASCRFELLSRSKDGSKFGYATLHDEDIDVAALVVKGSAAVKKDNEGESDSGDGGDNNGISNNLSDNDRDRDRDRDGGDRVAGVGGADAGGYNVDGGNATDSSEGDGTAVDDDSVSESDGYDPVSIPSHFAPD